MNILFKISVCCFFLIIGCVPPNTKPIGTITSNPSRTERLYKNDEISRFHKLKAAQIQSSLNHLEKKTKASLSNPDPNQIIIEAQKQLKKLGYKVVGKIDGIWGKNTKKAVRQFQKDNGLPVTGKLDGQTIKKLNLQSTKTRETYANPNDLEKKKYRISEAEYKRGFIAGNKQAFYNISMGDPYPMFGIHTLCRAATPYCAGYIDGFNAAYGRR